MYNPLMSVEWSYLGVIMTNHRCKRMMMPMIMMDRWHDDDPQSSDTPFRYYVQADTASSLRWIGQAWKTDPQYSKPQKLYLMMIKDQTINVLRILFHWIPKSRIGATYIGSVIQEQRSCSSLRVEFMKRLWNGNLIKEPMPMQEMMMGVRPSIAPRSVGSSIHNILIACYSSHYRLPTRLWQFADAGLSSWSY